MWGISDKGFLLPSTILAARISSRMTMDSSAFLQLVNEALQELPAEFRRALRNISLEVEDWPDPDLLEQLGYGRGGMLLGLFQGTPMTRKRIWFPSAMPDRIVIYKGPIEAVAKTDEEIRKRIRNTVLHEIGHFFGLDERKLKEHGYG